jgi:hypothetical protein
MKNIFTLLLLLISLFSFSQEKISFLSSETKFVNTLPFYNEAKPTNYIASSDFKFFADKDSINLGEGTFLNWDIPSEERVSISYSVDNDKYNLISDAFANKGKNKVNPKITTFYKIKSKNKEKIVKINLLNSKVETDKILKKPSIEYFYFEKDEVKLGESTMLKWSINNIANVTLENSINGINWSEEENALYGNIGEKLIYPKRKIYYRLVADDATISLILNVKDN